MLARGRPVRLFKVIPLYQLTDTHVQTHSLKISVLSLYTLFETSCILLMKQTALPYQLAHKSLATT